MKRIIIMFTLVALTGFFEAYGQPTSGKATSQFLFSEFNPASVIMKGGQTKRVVMNYNIISGTMMINQNNKLLNLVNPELVDTVVLEGKKFIPGNNCFLECRGGILMIQYKGSLMSPPKQAGYGTTSQTAAVTSLTTVSENPLIYDFKLPDGFSVDLGVVYYVKVNGELKSFLSERQLYKIFPGKEEFIKDYSRENKTDFKSQESVLALLKAVLK